MARVRKDNDQRYVLKAELSDLGGGGSDTLDDVTGRGNTTTNDISVGVVTADGFEGVYVDNPAGNLAFKRAGTQQLDLGANYFSGTTTGNFAIAHSQAVGGSPSYSWIGSLTTGMGLAATDTINFKTANVERVRISDTGNVGIGTTNPGYKLHVQGNAYLQNGNLNMSMGAYGVCNAGNTSQRMSFPALGDVAFENVNVGIGTTSPATALDVDGVVTATGVNLTDNAKAQFGASNDLQIYHDGSNSRIYDVGTGDLRIQGTNLRLQDGNGFDYMYAVQDSYVKLFWDGAEKLATTSAGIDVSGSVTASQYYISTAFIDQTAGDYGSVSVTGALGAGANAYSGWAVNDRLVLMNNGSTTSGLYNDTNNGWFIKCIENAAVSLYNAGSERLTTTSYGVSGVWSNNGTANLNSQIRKLTQAQYDAIGTPDSNTLYIIVG